MGDGNAQSGDTEPMETYLLKDLVINIDKAGVREYGKFSYPVRYGRFSEIRAPGHTFQYNLNGEIKFIEGRARNWPHPSEWLKRTIGNDWVYYSAGDYKGVYDLIGEYYYPYLSYPSNAILGDNPFEGTSIRKTLSSWASLQARLKALISRAAPNTLQDFLGTVAERTPFVLRSKAARLHRLIGGRVTVLPPDSRHVDYDVIPITVAEGCLLNCGFCRVKSGRGFKPFSRASILEQIEGLKRLLDRDLRNYSAIFLGQHDALQAGQDLIQSVAETAYRSFELERSHTGDPSLFLFASPVSLLAAHDTLFEMLDALPYATYINVGLEAADAATLRGLRRPVSVESVRDAFSRMLDINRTYRRIEVTANFLFSDEFSADHFASLLELTRNRLDPARAKGAIYLSPVVDETRVDDARRRDIIRRFQEVKMHSLLPVFLYLIQRL
jgi:hypothetical protein